MHIRASKVYPHQFRFGAKPSSVPMLNYCQLDHCGQMSAKLNWGATFFSEEDTSETAVSHRSPYFLYQHRRIITYTFQEMYFQRTKVHSPLIIYHIDKLKHIASPPSTRTPFDIQIVFNV